MQSMGKSLTFRGTVQEATQMLKTHRCKDPICDSKMWRVKQELDLARIKMRALEEELKNRGMTPAEDEAANGQKMAR